MKTLSAHPAHWVSTATPAFSPAKLPQTPGLFTLSIHLEATVAKSGGSTRALAKATNELLIYRSANTVQALKLSYLSKFWL